MFQENKSKKQKNKNSLSQLDRKINDWSKTNTAKYNRDVKEEWTEKGPLKCHRQSESYWWTSGKQFHWREVDRSRTERGEFCTGPRYPEHFPHGCSFISLRSLPNAVFWVRTFLILLFETVSLQHSFSIPMLCFHHSTYHHARYYLYLFISISSDTNSTRAGIHV